ncbi:uncharacterized protein M421DRAFT_144765 [Didymella exigua CBS 183.55]|uniref:Uncharacterized protein n=1 Tax=Didymella exigua CBS 183.55 TaxID=1150837 RepID=A0A6A5RNX6_9PLEO|nr:uncharacterized protein M421DRAFT_144765 [Didymella exigua CBS 183.55]KAF1929020.1 hypothetical protein M421DRAFT_144765 [Didymella exigua CBS 183.55]
MRCGGLDAGRLESSASASVTAVSALSCHPAARHALPDFDLLKGSAAACLALTRPLPRRLSPCSTTVCPRPSLHCSPTAPSPQQPAQPRFHHAFCPYISLAVPFSTPAFSPEHTTLPPLPHLPLSSATGAISVISTSSAATTTVVTVTARTAAHLTINHRHHDASL